MKTITLLILISFFPYGLFAQKPTPSAIEKELLRSFRSIDYWNQYRNSHRDGVDFVLRADDSLEKVNDRFGEKLKLIATQYPNTIYQKFNKLQYWGSGVVSSADKLFRIYSWDTEMGGTMHDYRNLVQYKAGREVNTILKIDTANTSDDGYIYYYSKLHTLKAGNKTYYLVIYNGIFMSLYCGEGIQVFSIENGRLNQNTKIIKTKTGLHSTIYYNYFVSDHDDILYDTATKTIKVPLINEKEYSTGKYITYKFNGKHFEKVK